MGLLPILSVIHTTTIGTMLNFNGGYNGHGIKKRYVQTDLQSYYVTS